MATPTRPLPWLGPTELRIGLGCMRLSTGAADGENAVATIAAAVAAGVTVFDTARAYAPADGEPGHNERLLARGVRAAGASATARIVTKGGMLRPGGSWLPDGRARTLRADVEASLDALDGLPIDTFLVHAPDPRTPWRTTLRALARIQETGLAARIGVCNVNRPQLDEALALAPISVVQVALSVWDDTAARSGVLERCLGTGVWLMAHSPLGGPARAARLSGNAAVAAATEAAGVDPPAIALAWLLETAPTLVAIPGATRPATATASAAAAVLRTANAVMRGLPRPSMTTPRTGLAHAAAGRSRRKPAAGHEIVLIMGVPGAGKTREAAALVARGYHRLNRDLEGGTLRALAARLDDLLAGGTGTVVLDNTYLTRAARSHVVEIGERHGVPVRCVWLDTPPAEAQVNLVNRLLERHGRLPGPDELKRLSRAEPGVLTPTAHLRAVRELEPPEEDEGFASIERVPFVRARPPLPGRAGVFVAAAALAGSEWRQVARDGPTAPPRLAFDWMPAADGARPAVTPIDGVTDTAFCTHPGGPPTCWCRPPLPGLVLDLASRHSVDPQRSTLVGTTSTHRQLARAIGAEFLEVPGPERPSSGSE